MDSLEDYRSVFDPMLIVRVGSCVARRVITEDQLKEPDEDYAPEDL